jgi:hypothetical protein
MTITFTNTRYIEDGSVGTIATVAEFSVWNCLEKKWSSAPKVVLRNILLAGLHPKLDFCIGEIETTETRASALNAFKPKGYQAAFFLDLASGSRNHGRFTFTNEKTIGKKYFGEAPKDQWKRIIYGSILHTGCKKLVYKQMKYVVVDDENKDSDGNDLDDAVNNIHWETGDSHAKASKALMQLLGLPLQQFNPDTGEDEELEPDENKPLQFRAAFRNNDNLVEWIGKGTVGYNPKLDSSEFDLVIPLSSLKGNKPALGNHQGKLLFGLVFEGELRRAKPGWMLLQWFSFEVLEKDNIISKLEAKCDRLSQAYNSITDLAEILRIDQSEAEAEIEEGSDQLQSEAEYENTMIRIIKADKAGLLLLHPYVVTRIKERMRAVWLNLAKAAGIRFYSTMAQPDESLAHYHVVLPDGRIKGKKVFCAPDFEPGEYIVFCNPMRHWGDCQLWENKHEGTYINATGIMAAPRKLLLNLGRDTDGDFIQLIKSSAYPNMRNAIANFEEPPATKKFPKMALQGNLQQIAINSMNDMTGIVASLLARARSGGCEQVVLNIPAGGEQKQDEEMPIIDFLSQQVQIAVDSLKSAYPNNKNGLDAVRDFLNEQGAESPWLKDFKDKECYLNRKCAVKDDALDTISRLVQTVNSYWKAPDLRLDSSPRTYEKVLFGNVEYAPAQLEKAMTDRTEYRAEMKKAILWKEENDDSTRMIREVCELFKASKESIYNTPKPDGSLYHPESWVAVYWKVAHQAETGEAGMVFTMFADEIIEKLKNMQPEIAKVLKVYAVQHGSWSAPKATPWIGQTVQIRSKIIEQGGKQKLAIEMQFPDAKQQFGWHHLGLVGEQYRPYYPPGLTKTMLAYSTRFVTATGKTSELTLFDPNMDKEDIKDFLTFK